VPPHLLAGIFVLFEALYIYRIFIRSRGNEILSIWLIRGKKILEGETMFRYFSVVLICGFYGFVSSAFANPQSATIPEDFRPHLIHHIQKQASSEYTVESRKASSSNMRYQAKNTTHKLALGFGAEGIDVRSEQDPEWRMSMKLSAIGYGENLQPVASGVLTTSGNRVEFRYGNAESFPEVTEWYLNGPLGLEQGFTLNRPPAGKKQSGHLVLALTLSGDLTAVPNDDGREVRFQTAQSKTTLRFRDLYVLDATGRQLASRFISAKTGYGIQVDDRSAVYPISIDPLLINKHQKLTASDAAEGDFFGVSVAVSGDTIVVGAWDNDGGSENSGSAYVFVRSGVSWTEQQKLTASDAAAGDDFGGSVAIDGDTAVVGARLNDDAGDSSGSAYVFVRSGTTWTEQQKLTASDAAERDSFGESVAVSGDTAVVGARWNDDAGDSSGSAYVFVRSGTTWTEQQKLTASDAAEGDFFGISVAISGDTAVVGVRNDDVVGINSGSAYVFVRSGTIWTEQQKLTASDAAAVDRFGLDVAISGDTVVVGAPANDDAGFNSGSVYIYKAGTFVYQGTMSGKMFCDDLSGTGVKEKFKKTMTFIVDTSQLPVVAAQIQMTNPPDLFEMTGMALIRSKKSGVLQLFGDDGGLKELALSGNIKLNKKTQEWKSIKGKFQFQDGGTPACTLAGKFKAK
jgi:FG-GAP repeat protein